MDHPPTLTRTPQELIQARTSVRSYHDREIETDLLQRMKVYSERLPRLFDTSLRIEILHLPSIQKDKDLKLGTYGIIRGTNYFIAAAHRNDTLHLLNAGYILEKVILYATELELGTCWLAGTFNRSAFAQAMALEENEMLPAIIALGYERTGSFNLMDTVFRNVARSRTRKSWDVLFFEQDFEHPLTPQQAGTYAEALEMVRLAPSASNKQPWRIVKSGQDFHFLFHRPLPHNQNQPFFNLPFVDSGIAMAHFELTCGAIGLHGGWHIQPSHKLDLPATLTYVATWSDV